jgi:hypothetical protein
VLTAAAVAAVVVVVLMIFSGHLGIEVAGEGDRGSVSKSPVAAAFANESGPRDEAKAEAQGHAEDQERIPEPSRDG